MTDAPQVDALLLLASVRSALKNNIHHYDGDGNLLVTEWQLLNAMQHGDVLVDERFSDRITSTELELIKLKMQTGQKVVASPRTTGYYWIIFNYGDEREPHWEPASWDAEFHAWCLFGSRQLFPESAESRIFIAIDENPIDRKQERAMVGKSVVVQHPSDGG